MLKVICYMSCNGNKIGPFGLKV